MQVVENLTQFTISAGNAAIGMATIKSQAMQVGLGAVQDFAKSKTGGDNGGGNQSSVTGSDGVRLTAAEERTLPNADALTDPGLAEAVNVQGFINALNQLIRGGEDYSPDWERIRGDSSVSWR